MVLTGLGREWILIGFLVFLRVGAAMTLLPVVGERTIPERIRLVIVLVYTLIVSSAVFDTLRGLDLSVSNFLLASVVEIVVGLAMGFGLRAFIFALQIAGSMAAQSTSLSQIFGGAGVDPQPAIGHLLLVAGMALAVTYGLHVKIAEFLIFSFQVISPGHTITAAEFSIWGLDQVVSSFSLAFSIAAPFVLAALIYNIALGAINKAMPQLMVSFVGAPAITAGGLILLLFCAPLILAEWQSALESFIDRPFQVAQ